MVNIPPIIYGDDLGIVYGIVLTTLIGFMKQLITGGHRPAGTYRVIDRKLPILAMENCPFIDDFPHESSEF